MEYSLEERRRQLYHQIREWNVNRLDLFSISEPNQVGPTLCIHSVYNVCLHVQYIFINVRVPVNGGST